MTFLSVVIAYLVLRWWGASKPLHRDRWFYRWSDWVATQPVLASLPLTKLAVSIAGPVLVLLGLLIIAARLEYWLQLLIAVPVLLYSVGRGKYSGLVLRYVEARHQRDWAEALACYKQLQVPGLGLPNVQETDWLALDELMLRVTSYRGFERTFAVLFWFILLGPAGAIGYRLSALYLRRSELEDNLKALAGRWLWWLEWPASRVLGFSFAMTGNFVGCIQSWRRYFWSSSLSTAEVLEHYVQGSLHVNGPESEDLTVRELKATLSLFSRTLIFWISALAVVSVLM